MPVATPGLPRTSASVVDLIGNTPLIRLSSFEAGLRNVELYAKAEWRNPGGSVKDRPAARMIVDGERSGALTRDKILLDATSGNTGIAYAMIGAARGYRVRLCVPGERHARAEADPQGVRRRDRLHRSDGRVRRRHHRAPRRCTPTNPDLYFYPDQYNNPGNWRVALRHDGARDHRADRRAHRRTSWRASARAARSSARAGGCASSIRRSGSISVQPDSPLHGLEGLKHMATAIVPGIYDPALADEDIGVGTEEAFELTRQLAQAGPVRRHLERRQSRRRAARGAARAATR